MEDDRWAILFVFGNGLRGAVGWAKTINRKQSNIQNPQSYLPDPFIGGMSFQYSAARLLRNGREDGGM
ncbi:hypothetical protein CRI94_15275 [Longibacter salinarum]|uniref:Uncharacterized protein n=1 Tax=Longibacter salinarum TaxID=1850348 RepID=A0A2A8CU43_9BACT|nr:hypothetical protein CRI94_15275 [Longibacter salinarum]